MDHVILGLYLLTPHWRRLWRHNAQCIC